MSFALFELAPGSYFDEFRLDPGMTPEMVAALRHEHGMDQNVTTRYFRWLASVVSGDWGMSLVYNSPVGPILFGRARNTLILTASAALCAWVIALPFAVWTAVGGRATQWFATSLVTVLLSVPEVILILALVALAAHWRVLPAGGMTSVDFAAMNAAQRAVDVLLHLIVPLAALVVAALPTLILHARAAVAEALRSPFIQFARSTGIPTSRLLLRHCLPSAAPPLITLLGLTVGTLLSSSLVVEAVAGWPGLGSLLLQALLQRDFLVVAGAVLLSSMLLLLGSLLADILLYFVDPRIREDG